MRIDLLGSTTTRMGLARKLSFTRGGFISKWEVAGASGYWDRMQLRSLGPRSEQKAGGRRLLWPTGVPQDEVNLAASRTHSIESWTGAELVSILFSWNGGVRIIADMIGPACGH